MSRLTTALAGAPSSLLCCGLGLLALRDILAFSTHDFSKLKRAHKCSSEALSRAL